MQSMQPEAVSAISAISAVPDRATALRPLLEEARRRVAEAHRHLYWVGLVPGLRWQ